MNRRVAWSVLVSALCATTLPAATPAEVDASIAKGVQFLYQRPQFQKAGNWEIADRRNINDKTGHSQTGPQWGGQTALCVYALLACGESANQAQLRKAIGFLRTTDMTGFYAIGLRAQIWRYLPRSQENTRTLQKDFDLLNRGIEKRLSRSDAGLYDYDADPARRASERIDLSVSQYGVLGMWACADFDLELPAGIERNRSLIPYWELVERKWRALQDKETGGWAYSRGHPITPSMTAAGVATLFITQEYLHARDGLVCAGNMNYPELQRGIDYLARALPTIYSVADNDHYTIFGIERIGVASGLKFIGNIDWYKAGADFLIRTQQPDGGWEGRWGREVATSYALLFLARGREPVTMNKIRYNFDPRGDGETRQGLWNQRARDVANASRYIGRQMEASFNWQLLDLSIATIDDLHDAPIAFIAGGERLSLPDAEVAKLKQFVEEGGLLVFNRDCERRTFSSSVTDLLERMFPPYKIRPLERDSVIFTNQQFKSSRWKNLPDVKALGNGVREFAIILDDDAGKSLQENEPVRRPEHFGLIANIYQYAIDKRHMQVKGRNHIVRTDVSLPVRSTLAVARLIYGEHSDPEPGGWRRMAAVMRKDHQLDLAVKLVQLGEGSLDGFAVAHLTGVGETKLEPMQIDALKAFVAKGGLLVIDAAGGDPAFVASMGAQLPNIVAGANIAGGERLQSTDPLFTAAGLPASMIEYRLFRNLVGDAAKLPSLHGVKVNGRWGLIFSADDLSVGLVGNEIDGIRGYSPKTATDLMTRILLHARDSRSR